MLRSQASVAEKNLKELRTANQKLRKNLESNQGLSEEAGKLKVKLKVHKKYIEELTDENKALREELSQLRSLVHQSSVFADMDDTQIPLGSNMQGERKKKKLRKASSSRISKKY